MASLPTVSFSLPTKKQVTDIVEYGIVGFVGSFVAVWIKQPNPFSKAAVLVGLTTAVAAVVALIKGLVFAG